MKLSYNWGMAPSATPGPPTNTRRMVFPPCFPVFCPTDWNTTSNRLNYDQTLTPTLLLHLGGAYRGQLALACPPRSRGYNATTGLGLTGPFTPLVLSRCSPAHDRGANNTGGSSNLGVSGRH